MDYLLITVGLSIVIIGVWLFREYRFSSEKKFFRQQTEKMQETISLGEVENAKKEANIGYLARELEKAEERIKEERMQFDKIKEQLKTDFQNLANRIFEEKSEKFTEKNRENLNTILTPLHLKIEDFREKIEKTHDIQTRDRIELREQIKNLANMNVMLSGEADNLVKALKGDNKTMGNWGEIMLDSILQNSGLRKEEEYFVQKSFSAEDGKRFQPDVIVNLPEEKHLVIDSKVSLVSYERYCSEREDEEKKKNYIKNHIVSIRKHMNDLSLKNYQELHRISSPDFVMMFIPVDPALIVALQNEPSLFTEAFEKGVFLVSPATLMFALRTVANLWKREKESKNAMEIARAGGLLYDKFVLFYEQMQKMGDYLKKAEDCYEDSLNKLKRGKGSLITRIEKIREMGARSSKSL